MRVPHHECPFLTIAERLFHGQVRDVVQIFCRLPFSVGRQDDLTNAFVGDEKIGDNVEIFNNTQQFRKVGLFEGRPLPRQRHLAHGLPCLLSLLCPLGSR